MDIDRFPRSSGLTCTHAHMWSTNGSTWSGRGGKEQSGGGRERKGEGERGHEFRMGRIGQIDQGMGA